MTTSTLYKGITIDDGYSRILDDGILIRRDGEGGGWLVDVCIARPCPTLLRYAMDRIFSDYMPDRIEYRAAGESVKFWINGISNIVLFSLDDKEVRSCFAFRMTVDPEGRLVSCDMDPDGEFLNIRRTTPDVFDAELAGGDPVLGDWSAFAGAVLGLTRRQPMGFDVVTACATLAKQAANQYAQAHEIPLIYRVPEMQPRPPWRQRLSVDSMGGTRLADVTSPLQYVAQLVNQTQIVAHLHGRKPPFAKPRLAEIARVVDLFVPALHTDWCRAAGLPEHYGGVVWRPDPGPGDKRALLMPEQSLTL